MYVLLLHHLSLSTLIYNNYALQPENNNMETIHYNIYKNEIKAIDFELRIEMSRTLLVHAHVHM